MISKHVFILKQNWRQSHEKSDVILCTVVWSTYSFADERYTIELKTDPKSEILQKLQHNCFFYLIKRCRRGSSGKWYKQLYLSDQVGKGYDAFHKWDNVV